MESNTFYDRALNLLNSHGLDFNWMSSKWTQNITIMAMKEFSDQENKEIIKKSEYEIDICRRECEEQLKKKDELILQLRKDLENR